jgi:hypothetical protein
MRYCLIAKANDRFSPLRLLISPGGVLSSNVTQVHEPTEDPVCVTEVHNGWLDCQQYLENFYGDDAVREEASIKKARRELWNTLYVGSEGKHRGHANAIETRIPFGLGGETMKPAHTAEKGKKVTVNVPPQGCDPNSIKWIAPCTTTGIAYVHRILNCTQDEIMGLGTALGLRAKMHDSEVEFYSEDKKSKCMLGRPAHDINQLLTAVAVMECLQDHVSTSSANIEYNRQCRVAIRLAQAEFAWKQLPQSDDKGKDFMTYAFDEMRGILDNDIVNRAGMREKAQATLEAKFVKDDKTRSKYVNFGRVLMTFPALQCLDIVKINATWKKGIFRPWDAMVTNHSTIACVLIHAALDRLARVDHKPLGEATLLSRKVALPAGTINKPAWSDYVVDIGFAFADVGGPQGLVGRADLGYGGDNIGVLCNLMNSVYRQQGKAKFNNDGIHDQIKEIMMGYDPKRANDAFAVVVGDGDDVDMEGNDDGDDDDNAKDVENQESEDKENGDEMDG